ncbi:hypothetical protein FXV77_10130 [Sphingobacterium phlebotomi]|uniref:T9SS C-terminal target domain-containing protein n=1 Tax=Sphingobacterium phlebotomi TaxID=2605433 RepID=A0A5D4H7J3_9SPHI|nr:hypothetical protein [Sphingobacterium phlebotomi]TYR36262.1 hypothetical protein FXV77_10130 [Sphingobacterium phlebotomi]
MKKVLSLAACAVALFSSCNKDVATPEGDFNAGLPTGVVQAPIPTDADGLITKTFLPNDTIWKIDGVSYVEPGQTLTIEAGTFLTSGDFKTYNDPTYGEQELRGVLVVPKTATLIAEGTANAPIVFTSPNATNRQAGDFGGVVILGRARINQPIAQRIEGIPQPDDTDVTYGSTNDTYNTESSGILKYVRIEFAGFELSEANEINGLTLGGVGSGTTLSHIQVSWGRDDAFEFFGGTVNADHLVALSTDDDDFDFDFGYSGTIQYALSLKDPQSTNSTSGGNSDSNGIESDNDGSGSNASPKTKPNLQNFTFLGINSAGTAGTKLENGNHWRRASALNITRSIIAGYNVGAAFENITAGESIFSNNVVHAYTTPLDVISGSAPAGYTGNSTSTAAIANSYLLLGGDAEINPFYSTATASTFDPWNLVPFAGPASGPDYKGAFDPEAETLWTDGWTEFQPKTY